VRHDIPGQPTFRRACCFVDDFRALRADIEGIWTRLMAFLAGKWADFLGTIAPTFNAVADRIGAEFRIDTLAAQAHASMLEHAAGTAGTAASRFRQAPRTHAPAPSTGCARR
jgi:hypothetical protein